MMKKLILLAAIMAVLTPSLADAKYRAGGFKGSSFKSHSSKPNNFKVAPKKAEIKKPPVVIKKKAPVTKMASSPSRLANNGFFTTNFFLWAWLFADTKPANACDPKDPLSKKNCLQKAKP
jgi:hypothetical protein